MISITVFMIRERWNFDIGVKYKAWSEPHKRQAPTICVGHKGPSLALEGSHISTKLVPLLIGEWIIPCKIGEQLKAGCHKVLVNSHSQSGPRLRPSVPKCQHVFVSAEVILIKHLRELSNIDEPYCIVWSMEDLRRKEEEHRQGCVSLYL